jgi:hypothetical protein
MDAHVGVLDSLLIFNICLSMSGKVIYYGYGVKFYA